MGLTSAVGGLPSYITLIPAVLQVFYTSRPNSVVCIAVNIDLLKSELGLIVLVKMRRNHPTGRLNFIVRKELQAQ